MELDTTKNLTKITRTIKWEVDWIWYTEHSLDTVKSVWKKKEWLPVWWTVIPYDPFNTKIEEADIADRYLYFVLPSIQKDHPDIAKKLKLLLKNKTKREREDITYAGIRWYVDREIHDKGYYVINK